MTGFDYSIDKAFITIQPGFSIKQFVVNNPSAYPVYINRSGALPNSAKADHTVQANSTFISPAIDTSIITIVSTVDASKVASVTVYDNFDKEPTNIPYRTYQFVSAFPNYPVTINSLSEFSNLPEIDVSSFDNILLLLSANAGVNQSETAFSFNMIPVVNNNVVGDFLAGFMPHTGGILSFSPPVVPAIYRPGIFYTVDPFAISTVDYIFNVVKTPETFSSVVTPAFTYKQYSSLAQTYTFYFGLDAGFFVYEALVQCVQSGIISSLTIDVYLSANAYTSQEFVQIASYNYAGTLPQAPDFGYLVTPKFSTVGHPAFLRIDITLLTWSVPLSDILVSASAISL